MSEWAEDGGCLDGEGELFCMSLSFVVSCPDLDWQRLAESSENTLGGTKEKPRKKVETSVFKDKPHPGGCNVT